MPSTEENLQTAFAGESQANRKYLAYATKAEQDGFPNIAALFRTAAEAETIHALAHLRSMGGVRGTVENLRDAVSGETYEHTTMYPPMVEQAEAEGHRGKAMLSMAMRAEVVHAELYQQALEAAEQGRDLETSEFYYCPVCGHVESGLPTEKCPICGAAPQKYLRVA
jgi:rubrerythrin